MIRRRLRWISLAVAAVALSGFARAADDPKALEAAHPKFAPRGFLTKYLTPRMDSRLTGEISAASYFSNPTANPWTQDNETVSRVERGALRATKGALKQYAIEQLGINAWSLPLRGARASGVSALRTESGGTRLFFGVSHLAPRAEVRIPVGAGRIGFSADVVGRVGTSFESSAGTLRFGAAYDPRTNDGTIGLTYRF